MPLPATKVSPSFARLPLLRAFYTLDMAEGVLYMHAVRRDPTTGLTLVQRTPVRGEDPRAEQKQAPTL